MKMKQNPIKLNVEKEYPVFFQLQSSDWNILINYHGALCKHSRCPKCLITLVILWCHQQVRMSLLQWDVSTAAKLIGRKFCTDIPGSLSGCKILCKRSLRTSVCQTANFRFSSLPTWMWITWSYCAALLDIEIWWKFALHRMYVCLFLNYPYLDF